MTKYEQLCLAYASARQASLKSIETCHGFAELFIDHLAEYFQCGVEMQNVSFDEQGSMHFYPAITLYADPQKPSDENSEVVIVSLSLEKSEEGYLVTIFPWETSFELLKNRLDKLDDFIPIYDFIHEQILVAYEGAMISIEERRSNIRNLGWDF
ncbi:MAG: hypothetical protein ACRC6M_01185 [Microcystaceae cyanobacterium]